MERYYYLIYSLFFLGLLAILLLFRRDLLRFTYPALLFGVFAGPFSQLMYLVDYWRPLTLLGPARVSIEDSIFGLAIFGLSFLVYPVIARRGFVVPQVPSRLQHKRFMISLLIGAGLFAWMSALGVNSVITSALVFVILWVGIAIMRRDLFLPGLFTGFCLVALASIVYGIGLSVIPTDFLADSWLLHNQSLGVTIAGKVPVTELMWFFGTGCFLSVFDLFTSGKRYKPLGDNGERPSNRAARSSSAGTPEST